MITLPDGWKIVHDWCIGYTMYDENEQILGQHPVDSDAWRKLCIWAELNRREQEAGVK